MCRYAVIEATDDEATKSGKAGKVLAFRNELSEAFTYAETYIAMHNTKAEIFERISVGKPVTAVTWEGRRRPAIANGG
jgi:hypothetical protein